MNDFVIEKDIPVPTNRRVKYPWGEMSVGDSIVVLKELRSSALASAQAWSGRNKDKEWVFVSRFTNDNEARLWRIK